MSIHEKIKKAKIDYYAEESELSDGEYDALEEELRLVDPNCEELKVIEPNVGNWPKAKHLVPCGSLDKVQNEEDWTKWWSKLGITDDVVVSDKLDGISIELVYSNGIFKQAITRGADGLVGEDITPNVTRMKGIPKTVKEFTGSIRGEIIITHQDFKDHFDGYRNPRNAAAGTAKRLDGTGCEHLSILCYDMVPTPCDTYEQTLCHLLDNGFATPTYSKVSCNTVPGYVRAVFQNRATTPYDIDGAVVRVNNNKVFTKLGDLNMNPRGATAYKPPPEVKATIIREVTWQVGMQCRLTPVAEIEPVDIGGVTISRVSLHTAKNAMSSNAGVGASVLVSRANEVIPYLAKVVEGKPISAPEKCPSCNKKNLSWDGEYLECINPTCPSVLFGSIKVWTDRLNILNWGTSFINSIIHEMGVVHNLSHIYDLDWGMVGDTVGHGVAERARKSLESCKKMTLAQFIAALNIKGCQTTAKDIVSAGYDTVDKFISLDETTLSGISGIGPVKAASIASGIKQLEKTVRELVKYVTIEAPKVGRMSGKSFCITGKLSKPRAEIEKMIVDHGGEVKSSVGKGTSYLVTNEGSNSSKSLKAKALKINIISEAELMKLLN